MGKSYGLVDQLQEENSAAVGYEEVSEEEEPYECEFYDDDDEPQDVEPCEDPVEEELYGGTALPENDNASDEEPFEVDPCDEDIDEHGSFHLDPHAKLLSSGHSICRKRLYEAEPHDLLADEDGFFEDKSVQPLKKEKNKGDLKQVLKRSKYVQEDVLVAKEKETKPFKKRLSVKFADDVSCYTYSDESFAAAKLEKKKAQVGGQEKYLCNRPEQSASSPQDAGRLEGGDGTNLFVGNLPPSVASHKLIQLFLPFGRIVRSRVVDDCFTGLSKGYGFVKYANSRCATEAIKRMNGRTVEGRMLQVRVADAPSSGSNPLVHSVSVTAQPAKEMDMSNLYVCNLPLLISTDKLLDLFAPYGQVTSAKVARDYTTGLSKGYGFVKYSNPDSAAQAVVQLNGRLFEGMKIEVRVCGIPPRPAGPLVESHLNNGTIREIDMSNLYVYNIPSSMSSNKLVELFLPFGKITHAKIMEKTNDSSKGYGFIKFEDSQSAAEAVASMNGALIDGETISVTVAGLSQSASSSVLPHSAANPSLDINKSRLYITNLPHSVTADKLISLFMPFGQINKVVMNSEYSLLFYADVHSATKAVRNMDGYLIEGKLLVVKGAQPCPSSAADHAFSQSGSLKEIDMANLFVGCVPSTVTANQLIELFCPFGEIIQARKFSRGYGMVRYANPSSAAAAIDHMHGYQIGGSTLVVRVAGLPGETDATTNVPTVPMLPGNVQRKIDMANLYVCHLPLYVTTEKLIELFLPCGHINQAKVVVDKFTGVSKGFGFVKFADAYSAAVALTHMNGYPLDGHVLEVRIANVPQRDMNSHMAHFYSQFASPDPSRMAVGVPTSYWPYYYTESTYATPSEYQGQGAATATAIAADQTTQQECLLGSNPVGSVADKDCSCVSNAEASDPSRLEGWAGPPGFEPHAVKKNDATVANPSQARSQSAGWTGPPGFEPHHGVKKEATVIFSKVHLTESGGSQKRVHPSN